MAMLTITTVPSTVEPAKGYTRIDAPKRSTEKNPVPPEMRYRGVDVPEFCPPVEDKFIGLVVGALTSLAKNQLAVLRDTTDPREVDSELFSIDSLLAFGAQQAESQRLTKESIEAWYESSMLRKFILKRYNPTVAKRQGEMLTHLAPNAKVEKAFPTEDACAKAIAFIGSVEEPEDDTMQERLIKLIQKRLDEIRSLHESIGSAEDAPF